MSVSVEAVAGGPDEAPDTPKRAPLAASASGRLSGAGGRGELSSASASSRSESPPGTADSGSSHGIFAAAAPAASGGNGRLMFPGADRPMSPLPEEMGGSVHGPGPLETMPALLPASAALRAAHTLPLLPLGAPRSPRAHPAAPSPQQSRRLKLAPQPLLPQLSRAELGGPLSPPVSPLKASISARDAKQAGRQTVALSVISLGVAPAGILGFQLGVGSVGFRSHDAESAVAAVGASILARGAGDIRASGNGAAGAAAEAPVRGWDVPRPAAPFSDARTSVGGGGGIQNRFHLSHRAGAAAEQHAASGMGPEFSGVSALRAGNRDLLIGDSGW